MVLCSVAEDEWSYKILKIWGWYQYSKYSDRFAHPHVAVKVERNVTQAFRTQSLWKTPDMFSIQYYILKRPASDLEIKK